jgi:hypothetical protein
MKKCKHCQIEMEKGSQHQRWCVLQPNGKPQGNRKGQPAWNSGLQGDPRLKHSQESKDLLSKLTKDRGEEWHKENGRRISETVNKKVADGTWHTSLAKKMHKNYNGVDLHGSWEVAYAKYLDLNNIKWMRCRESFSYVFDGKERKYTPDFYLIETDVYIEIKGYKTEKDVAKWNQFPKHRKLIVLMKKELEDLKVLC